MPKNIPSVPRDLPVHQQQFLQAMKDIIESAIPPNTPPGVPTNITAHPMPGGVQITFTAGQGAEKHLLLISDKQVWDPTKVNNHVIDLGKSTMHVHQVGQSGVARYFWIVAARGSAETNPPTGPVSATTLALNVAAGNSKYVPLSQTMVKNAATNRPTIYRPRKGGIRDLL